MAQVGPVGVVKHLGSSAGRPLSAVFPLSAMDVTFKRPLLISVHTHALISVSTHSGWFVEGSLWLVQTAD